MKKFNMTKKMIGTIAALPFAFSSIAVAVAADAQPTDEKIIGIEVIEITSEKRISTLQETPIPISAFNASELARQGIENSSDIQFAIPNAVFTDRGTFNIRGVGNSAISSTAESGTGVHINGVYLTAPSAVNEFYDLQTIEVLRGPQGTLYGRNTTAGVVNIITQRPTYGLEGNLSVEVGNFDSIRTVGAINIPISEEINQRFAFNTVSRGGFTENIKTGNDIDGRDQFSIRSTTLFEPSEDFNATLFAQYFKEDSDRSNRRGVRCIADEVLGCSNTEIGFEYTNTDFTDGNIKRFLGAAGAAVRPDFYNFNPDGSRKINPSDPRKVNIDNEPIVKADELLVSLELNYDVDGGTFTSVTAYHETDGEGQRDYDNANGSNAFFVPLTYQFNDDIVLTDTFDYESVQLSAASSEQKSQEFRFVSSLDSALNYTAGVYWLNYKRDSRVATYVPFLTLIGQGIGLPGEYLDFDTRSPEVETTSWAVFGELYYDITDKLKLTAGARLSNEEKSQKTQTVTPFSFFNPTFDPTVFEELENDWRETTGKIGLSYQADFDATDETLFFGTIARGYKAGGLNPGGATKKAFDAEYINSIEFGTKNTFSGRTFQANATVFHYKYDGLQLGALEQTGTGAAITDNTDAEVTGAEFEFVYAPIEGLLANLNLSLLDTEVTGEFSTPDSAQPSSAGRADIRGNSLPYAPEKSIQFGIEYSHSLADDWDITYRAQTYWQDSFQARVYNSATDDLESWKQTDLTVSLNEISGAWGVDFFVKNLDNDASITGMTVESSLTGRFRLPAVLDPRQFGVRVHYRFE